MEDDRVISNLDLPDQIAEEFQQRVNGIKEILDGYHGGLAISILAVVSANAVTSVKSEIIDEAIELFLKTFNSNIKMFRGEESQ